MVSPFYLLLFAFINIIVVLVPRKYSTIIFTIIFL
jgi:hypothetical protein